MAHYPCPYCPRQYTRRWNQERHIRSTHQASVYYRCDFPECGKLYGRRWDALRHKRKHPTERPALCPRDGCSFSSLHAARLQKHAQLSHRGAYVCKIEGCPHAGTPYPNERQLQQHRQTCHSLEELTYPLWSVQRINKKAREKCPPKETDRELVQRVRRELQPSAEPQGNVKRKRRCPALGCSFSCYSRHEYDLHQATQHSLPFSYQPYEFILESGQSSPSPISVPYLIHTPTRGS